MEGVMEACDGISERVTGITGVWPESQACDRKLLMGSQNASQDVSDWAKTHFSVVIELHTTWDVVILTLITFGTACVPKTH